MMTHLIRRVSGGECRWCAWQGAARPGARPGQRWMV